MIPVYPDYQCLKIDPDPYSATKMSTYKFRSRLRTLHTDGKYYLHMYVFNAKAIDFEQAVKMFIRQSYIYTKFYKVDPELEDGYGRKLFDLDPNQISEEERMML